MRLYRVRDGELISTKVVKETPKLYWINDYMFDFRSNFYKDHACTTPEEAIQEGLNNALTSFGIARDRFKRAIKRLKAVKILKDVGN